MAQLEGNSGKKDVPAAGSKDPVNDASSNAKNAFGQGEAKATPAISDTPLFQTTLRQEETAAASKFAESVWKPLEKEKDKDKNDLPPQQAFAIAPSEAPRVEVKNQVEVSKVGSLLRTAHGDEEQVINKLLATNSGDKGAAPIGEKRVGGEAKKDIGPVTSLSAVADSITKDALDGTKPNFKVNTNELKSGALSAPQEGSAAFRNDIRPLIKDEITNPLQKLDQKETSSRNQSAYSFDATPTPRVDSNPIIKTAQGFQPQEKIPAPDKVVSAGGGFFEIPEAKQKPYPELGKSLSDLGSASGQNVTAAKNIDLGYGKADSGPSRVEPIVLTRGFESAAPAIKQNMGTENISKTPINDFKSLSHDLKTQIGGDEYAKRAEPNISKSEIYQAANQGQLKELIKSGSADVGAINNIQTSRFEPGKAYNPQVDNLKLYDGSKSAAALGVDFKQGGIDSDISKKNMFDGSMQNARALSNTLQEPPRSLIDSGNGKPAIIYPKAVESQPLFKDPQVGLKPEISKPFTTGPDFGSNGLGKVIDGGQVAPAGPGKFEKVVGGSEFKPPSDGVGILGKQPIGQIDAGALKPLPNVEIGKSPTGPQQLGAAESGEKFVPSRPGQPGIMSAEVNTKTPISDSVSRTPPQTVSNEGVGRQQPGVSDSLSKPGIPADIVGSKPGVVVNPVDGSFKATNPGTTIPETKVPETTNPGTKVPETKVPGTSNEIATKPVNTVDIPRTSAPADVKPGPFVPKSEVAAPKADAPKAEVAAPKTDAPKAPVTISDTTKLPVTAGDGTKAPVTVGDATKPPVTVGDANAPKTSVKPGDATTVTDSTGKNSGRANKVDPVSAFEQSTQRVRQLAEGRFDPGFRSGPLETALNGRVTQTREVGTDAKPNVIDSAKAQVSRQEVDVRSEAAKAMGTSRGISSEGPAGRRVVEPAAAVRDQQLTSFDPQGKNVTAKVEPNGPRIADLRDPQVRVDVSNPSAGIGRIPLSASVRVADIQPGISCQNVDGRVAGDVGRLPVLRGFGQISDGTSFTSHGEIRAPRGETHRYITGLELALILSIAGIAKIRHDSRSGAARLEGRTWSITRQNGRPLIYIDGRQNPLQPQRVFGKGDGSFRIMVSTKGEQAAKLSTRTMRTTDIAQTKATDASSANSGNLGLLGKFHYMNYFGKNMPATNYYGQFRSTSYTGSMGLAFVMAASGMTRPAGGMETIQGVDKLNPITMGPADRIRMQNQSLLTQLGRFNLDVAVGSSSNGRDIGQKESTDEKQDKSLSVLDDYQDFLNRLDGFSKKKEETEDEAAIINRKISFGVENLYDQTSEGDKSEDVLEKDDTSSSALSQVLRRPKWVVQTGDTLDGLAERFFSNADLGWLIADLNRSLLRETYIDNKRIVEMQSRLEIELPVWQDIQKFNQNRKKNWTAENLVTIIVERQIDREVVESVLAKVVGAEA